MKEAAENLEFEEAAKIRDEIRKLEASELEIGINPKSDSLNCKIKFIPKEDQLKADLERGQKERNEK